GQVGDALGVGARVRVARVDGLREAGGGAEACGAVGAGGEPLQLGDLDYVGSVDAGLVLAVLLGPVEGAVRAAYELVAVHLVERHRRDPGADRDRAGRRQVGVGDPVDDRL